MDEQSGKPILVGIAFLLPLFFIAVVFFTTYLPSRNLSTDYDFVYATCNDANYAYGVACGNYLNSLYAVDNDQLTETAVPPGLDSDRDGIPDVDENYQTRLFFYDTDLDESREISFAEARELSLRDLISSPDGVTVEWRNPRSNGFFLFYDSRSSAGYYLTRGNTRRELNIIGRGDRRYYQDDFMFIGWVLTE